MGDPGRPSFASPAAPAGWEELAEPLPATLWVAVEPGDGEPGTFRANLVLTCDDISGTSFRDWQVATDELLPRTLDDYLLVDLERLEIDGLPGGRRLAHHVDRQGRALTMEQWFTRDEDRGWTLTATVDTWRYDELADACGATAARWRPVNGQDADADRA